MAFQKRRLSVLAAAVATAAGGLAATQLSAAPTPDQGPCANQASKALGVESATGASRAVTSRGRAGGVSLSTTNATDASANAVFLVCDLAGSAVRKDSYHLVNYPDAGDPVLMLVASEGVAPGGKPVTLNRTPVAPSDVSQATELRKQLAAEGYVSDEVPGLGRVSAPGSSAKEFAVAQSREATRPAVSDDVDLFKSVELTR